MNGPTGFPRRVVVSSAIHQRLKELAALASQRGQLKQFTGALRKLITKLETRPLPPGTAAGVFGCPEYHLHSMHLTICVAIVPPVTAVFAVSESLHPWNGTQFQPIYLQRVGLLDPSDFD
jgi:hypothetical protein